LINLSNRQNLATVVWNMNFIWISIS
jgi:hypothetical protein